MYQTNSSIPGQQQEVFTYVLTKSTTPPHPTLHPPPPQTTAGLTVSPAALLSELSAPETLESPPRNAAAVAAMDAFSALDEAMRTSAGIAQDALRGRRQ